jgi:hypothetical protein
MVMVPPIPSVQGQGTVALVAPTKERVMGLFKNIWRLAGVAAGEEPTDDSVTSNTALLATGLLGRGVILGIEQVDGSSADPDPVCVVGVEVALDNTPAYAATCQLGIPAAKVAQLAKGAAVAVRVDPADHTKVTLDFDTAPPVVTIAGEPGRESAADILAKGTPARVAVVEASALGMKNPAGVDLYRFQLTVTIEGRAPYQVEVGNPVPPDAVALLYPGSNLPAKVMPGSDNSVAIDWPAAIAEAGQKK